MLRNAIAWLLSIVLAGADVVAALAAPPLPAAATAPRTAASAGQRSAPLPIGLDDLFRFHARSVEIGGSLVLGFQDISIPARGAPLALARFYRSDLAHDSGLGRGWGWSFGVKLRVNDITRAPEIIEESGRISAYEWRSESQPPAVSGRLDSVLARQGAGVIRVFADGSKEVFDRGGRLIERWAGGGLAQRIRYDGDRPTEVSDWAGRQLQFTYADGRLESVTDPLGRTIRYRYDERERLVGTEDALGRRTAYAYDGDDRLNGIGLADGGSIVVTYGEDGRVAKLTGPGDLETRFQHERSFDETRRALTMIDGLGHASSVIIERRDQATEDPHIAVAITNAMGERTAVELRPGRATVTSPGLPPLTVELDGVGRPVRLILPDGTSIPVPSAEVDTPVTVRTYDEFGYPLVEEVAGAAFRIEHDLAGRRIAAVDDAGHRASFEYDDGDRLLKETDILGLTVSNRYDAGDRLVESTDRRGNTTRFAYQPRGLLETIEVPGERTFRFRHDAVGRLVELSDGYIGDTYGYDAADRLIVRTDQSGNRDEFVYDAAGRLIAFIDNRGRRTDLEPDLLGLAGIIPAAMGETWRIRQIAGGIELTDAAGISDRIIQSTDGISRLLETPSGRVASEEYDEEGRLIRRQLPGEAAELWTYDERGLLIAAGPTGRETSYEYDARGNLIGEERPDGRTIEYERDTLGRLIRQTDNRGSDTRYEYDERGDMIAVTDARGVRSEYSWDRFGRLVHEDDGLRVIDYRYDERGRLTSRAQAGGWTESLVYDDLDRPIERTESAAAISRRWRFGYDRFDQLVEIVCPDGTRQQFERDPDGRIRRLEDRGVWFDAAYDPAGNLIGLSRGEEAVSFDFDADGRLTMLVEPAPREFEYGQGPWPERVEDGRGAAWLQAYNAYGELLSLTDRLGGVTRFERDGAGRLEATIDPSGRGQENVHDTAGRPIRAGILDGPAIAYTYDDYGDLASVERPDGTVIAYRRDARGRLTAITLDGRPLRSFTYDARGRLITATDELGEHRFAYDEAGYVVAETNPFGHTLRRGYDRLGRTADITVDGRGESYRYGENGHLNRIVGIDGGETVIERDMLLRVKRVTHPGGTTAELAYDIADRPTGLTYRDASGNIIAERRYERDAEGEIVAIAAGATVSRYTYDAESQLAEATIADGAVQSYEYDAAGNPIGFGELGSLAYDRAYRLTTAGNHAARHDPAGNLTAIEGIVEFGYDAVGRLASATAPAGETVTFRYDFLDRLVERSGPEGTIRYQYDGQRLLAAYDGEGRLLHWVERLPEGPGTARLLNGETPRLVMADALGTPIADLGPNGVTAVSFSPWGRTDGATPSYADLIGFTGAPTDPLTGIVTLGLRAYFPAIGRFLQPDPAGVADGVNPYRYAENNPLGRVDITGLLSISPFPGGWMGTGGYFEWVSRMNAAYDILSATPSGSGHAGRLPGVNIDEFGRPFAVTAPGPDGISRNRIPGMWEGTTITPDPNSPRGFQVGRPRPVGRGGGPPSIVEGFDTEHFRSTYGRGRLLTDPMGVFDLPGEPPSPQRPNGLAPRTLYQIQTSDGVYEYVVTRDGRITHSLFKPGAQIDGYVNREGAGRQPRDGNTYGGRGPVWDRVRNAVERSGRRDFYTEVSRTLERYTQATNRAVPTFARAGSRIIHALEKTRVAFPRAFPAIGYAGAALTIYSTYRDFTDPNVSWGQALTNLAINAALFALPLLGPAGVAIAAGIAAGMLLAGVLEWLFNNDPTFITVARGPPRRAARRLFLGARGPPAPAEIWLDQPATITAAVYRPDGSLVRDLGTYDVEPGFVSVAWDGTDDTGAAVADGNYSILLASAATGGGPAPVRRAVEVRRSAPEITLGAPEQAAGRVNIQAGTDRPTTLAWYWLDGQQWRPLGGDRGAAGSLSLGAADLGGRTEARLRAIAMDEAGNVAEAEIDVTLPPLPPDQVVEIDSIRREIAVRRIEPPISSEDRLPHWLSGATPAGAETIGEWRWDTGTLDPLGAAAHISRGDGRDIHYVLAPESGWFLSQQDAVVQYLRIDPQTPPRQIALQLYLEAGDGEHRASFGEKLIDFGAAGGTGLVDAGPVPQAGEWLRLAVPAHLVGAGGRRVTGVLFAAYGGAVAWGTTSTTDADDGVLAVAPASATVPVSEVSVQLEVSYRPVQVSGTLDVAVVDGSAEWPIAADVALAPGPRHFTWTGPENAAEQGSLRFRAALPDGTVHEQVVPIADFLQGPPLIARIDYPPEGAIGRERVPIFGQAGGSGFERYVVDLRPVADPDAEWHTIAESTTAQGITELAIGQALNRFSGVALRRTISGNLASVDTGSLNYRFAFRPSGELLPPGRIIVRLRTFGADDAVAEDSTLLVIGEVADDRKLVTIRSADGLARLEIPPLAMPADVGALAVEPASVTFEGGETATGYRLIPPGLALRSPGRLVLPANGEPAEITLVAGNGASRPTPVVERGAGWVSVSVERFPVDEVFVMQPLRAPAAPLVLVPPEPTVGPTDLVAVAEPGLRVELRSSAEAEPVSRATAGSDGLTLLEGVPFVPGDNRFEAVAVSLDGTSSAPAMVNVVVPPGDAQAGQVAEWTDLPDRVEAGEPARIAASLDGAPMTVEAIVSGPDGERSLRLVRAGAEHVGTLIADSQAGTATVSLLGESREIAVVDSKGPAAPLAWPIGLAPPVWRGSFIEGGDGTLVSERTIGSEDAPTLSLLYRLQPNASAMLVLRGESKTALLPLAGAVPNLEDDVRLAAAPDLAADGNWHFTSLSLPAMIGDFGSIARIELFRSVPLSWNVDGIAEAEGVELRDAWLGQPWPPQGPARVALAYADKNIAEIEWVLDRNLAGPASDANAARIEGRPEQLSLPALEGSGIFALHVRARDLAGNWGAWSDNAFLIDRDPPRIEAPQPPPDSESAELRASFRVLDEGTGFDVGSLAMSVNGITVTPDAVRYDPVSRTAAVAFGDLAQRPKPDEEGRLVVEITKAVDLAGNRLREPYRWSWRFDASRVGSGDARLLTTAGGADAVWSPDGNRVVYVSDKDGSADLYELDLASGGERRLTEDAAVESSPSYADDGRLVFATESGIVALDPTSGSIDSIAGQFADPRWSDGAVLAAEGNRVVRIDPATGTVSTVVTLPDGVTARRPGPAGRRVVFGESIYHESIWAAEPGGAPVPLSTGLDDPALLERDPAADPTGRSLAFAAGGLEPGLWLSDLDGRERSLLLATRAQIRRPNWSHDGRRLVFDSDANGVRNLWLLEVGRLPEARVEPPILSYRMATPMRLDLELDVAATVAITVADRDGLAVRDIRSPAPATDRVSVAWDGRGADGDVLPDGRYQLVATVEEQGRPIVVRLPVSIDNTPPRTSAYRTSDGRAIGPGVLPGPDEDIVLRASDGPDGAGVARLEYRADGEDEWRPFTDAIASSELVDAALIFRSVDRLDQIEEPQRLDLATGAIAPLAQLDPPAVPEPSPAPQPTPPAVEPERPASIWIIVVLLIMLAGGLALVVVQRRRRV